MDDSFKLSIQQIPYFSIHGRFRQMDILDLDLSHALSDLIMENKELNHRYEKLMAKDNRIIGQEKAEILQKVSQIMVTVLSIRVYIEKKIFEQELFNNVAKSSDGFHYNLSIRDNVYNLSGQFSVKKFNELSGFQYWEDDDFQPFYERLLKSIPVIIADGKITFDEGRQLTDILDEMLHSLIIIYYKLDSYFIKK